MIIKEFRPKLQYFTPTIECFFETEYYISKNLPLSGSGRILYNGIIIANISNFITYNNPRTQPDKPDNYHETLQFLFDIVLSKEIVNFIHESRQKATNQNVNLSGEILIHNLETNSNSTRTNIIRENFNHSIASSDWISNFCPKFGIGNFSVIEINHSGILNQSQEHLEQSYYKLIASANDSFTSGDYIGVIHNARKFLEKSRSESSKIIEYSSENVNTTEYGEDLNKLINTSFQFVSKYQHTHSKGKEELNLNVTKEDAQMCLFLILSLTSLLSKIKQNVV